MAKRCDRDMTHAIGIDVGGTKIAAGLVDGATGRVLRRRQLATCPERGGEAILADCAGLAAELGGEGLPVGIGICELVDLDGRPASAQTVDWRDLDLDGAVGGTGVTLASDVRAAALAEARFGAGKGRSSFLFAVVGTGASVCLVLDGQPHHGERGYAVVLGAPPVEAVSSGPALARAAGRERAEDVLADPAHAALVDERAAALGEVLAVLANALDPSLVVLGGGLGAEPAFRSRIAASCQALLAYPPAGGLEIVGTHLGTDGGLIGAALTAIASTG